MHVLFDEAGKFLAGRILSEAEASAQVELDSGKRVKVKAANQLLRFDKPAPAELLAQAQALVAELDPALAWEFAPEDEFGFAELAADYFGGAPGAAQQAAALLALHEAPHYFRRAGKGRFRKAPADIVAQALAAIEKKKQVATQIASWAGELAAGQCPAPVREQLYRILFRPDKNAPEYKAVVEASRATQLAPLALLQRAGAIESAYQFHWQRFLFDNFPQGTGFPRPDYSFRLVGNDGAVPTGAEQVRITTRARGAPLDLIVSELMILANSSWGEWLKSLGVPAIYRSQASLLPGIKVRMGARALPHAGLGVPSYAWSTSPLRRYVDLVNQWQIIAAARHGTAAALAAPFKPKDAALLAIISGFDAAYSAYGAHQAGMERFWTLRYLRQEGIGELSASLLREQGGGAWLVRADTLPLVFTVMGAQGLPRGTRVRVRLGQIDDIALDVHGTVIEVLDAAAASPEPADEEDESAAAGPIAIAVDLDEADSASKDNPAS